MGAATSLGRTSTNSDRQQLRESIVRHQQSLSFVVTDHPQPLLDSIAAIIRHQESSWTINNSQPSWITDHMMNHLTLMVGLHWLMMLAHGQDLPRATHHYEPPADPAPGSGVVLALLGALAGHSLCGRRYHHRHCWTLGIGVGLLMFVGWFGI